MKIGQIVLSGAGRDKGRYLVIVSMKEAACWVADGKERPLLRPKRKNQKHLIMTGYCLSQTEYGSDKALRKALRSIRQNKMNSLRGGI